MADQFRVLFFDRWSLEARTRPVGDRVASNGPKLDH